MSFATRLLGKTVKYGTVVGGSALGVSCGYVYFTTPPAIPASGYRNFTPRTDRKESLDRLKNEVFDIVVVGGGATGASVALDGASRGLKVALLEREDFSSGTSSRSTKLLHGGVRYLKDAIFNLDYKMLVLVYEALRERAHMLHCSPFMTQPLAILMPLYKPWDILMMWAGLKMYEFCGNIATLFSPGLPNSYWVSKSNSLHMFPLLKNEGLLGSVMYYDGQQNDSRVCLHIAMTAAVENYIDGWEAATVANHTNVLSVTKDEQGMCSGVKAKDELTGETFEVTGKMVINATGPFSDIIRKDANPEERELVAAAAGAHLVMPKSYSSPACGMLIPETADGRVLFYLPWEGNTVVGTTDVKSDLTPLPKPTTAELDFIVEESVKYLSLNKEDIRQDITAAWSGLRPLVRDPKAADTSKMSRDHEVVIDSTTGLVSIMGGKWTTCRLMAEDCLNKALDHHRGRVSAKYGCRTFRLALLGSHGGKFSVGHGYDFDVLADRMAMELNRSYGVDLDDAVHLTKSYGTYAPELCEFGQTTNTLSPLLPRQSFLRTEILWAIDREMAESAVDVIAYRTRMAFVDPVGTKAILPEIVSIIGDRKGWDKKKRAAEMEKAKQFLRTMTYGEGQTTAMVRRRTYRDVPVSMSAE
ncbi:mitochondrial glycerol-3-phosphate dehydrogenase [Perkinsus olseni]|uniref:glycerol-3-phosphate dehydrogenase n=2 Tax=Perkinsus olseni TaxID=32597 RepID=A0A7J6NEE6_PEROL|nr:mitochondrial glycerol-3-phosphate dehydrogenase [Perkinsus olseni]